MAFSRLLVADRGARLICCGRIHSSLLLPCWPPRLNAAIESAAAADADQARSRGICQRRRLQDIGTSEKLGAKTIRRIVVKLMGFAVGNERAVFHDANLVRQGQGFGLIGVT